LDFEERSFMLSKKLIAVVTLLLLTAPAVAFSKEAGDQEEVYAIQERIFDRYHELGLVAGFIPDGDFYNGFPAGLSYTFNFNENLAWEVVRAQWVFNDEKDLKKDLEDNFGVTPSEFYKIEYLVHTNFVLKPSYGKDALRNKKIINHSSYILAGAGLTGYKEMNSQGDEHYNNVFSLSFGVGRKYFLNQNFCLNLELRDFVSFREGDTENNVYIGLGLGFRFDLTARRRSRDDDVDHLKRYMKENDGNE
jgi:outer membrane beta-barrel protein